MTSTAFLGIDSLRRSSSTTSLIPWAPILLFALIVYFMWRMLRLMPKTKPQEISPRSKSAVTWDDVAGVEETKDELREVVDFLSDPKRFKQLGAKVPKGILLHGPPGTGKTLLAKAVAHESGRQLLQPVGLRRSSRCSPASARRGSGACSTRRARTPPRSSSSTSSTPSARTRGSDISGERDQTLNQLLVEMDGFEARDNVVVMAASNLLEKLDKALLRPGPLRPPGLRPAARPATAASEILEVHTRDKPLGQDVDLERVARHTAGLTGADLANLANEAAILAGRNKRDFIAQADFDDAFERVVAGLQSRKVITDHEKRVVAWHEAGHALVSELLPTRRQGAEGLDRPPRQGARLHAQPAAGGPLPEVARGADRLHEGPARRPGRRADHLRPGHHRRLRRPQPGDRRSPARWSTSTGWGRRSAPTRSRPTTSPSPRRCARRRDEEVQAIAEEAYRGATELLTDHRDLLDEIAERLLANEVIERDEIQRDHGRAPRRDRRRAGRRTDLEPAAGQPGRGARVAEPPPEPRPARRVISAPGCSS